MRHAANELDKAQATEALLADELQRDSMVATWTKPHGMWAHVRTGKTLKHT